ncbi:hypothetical protein B0A49_01751 [Cryomyces minteri]|uniref:Phosphoglycerate mutase n=1 Tax=Cryomyces minteri TaxID=331657 RepID=A0A4U0XSU2_9PEZI|nr:hypothetical protein B0A49_01751 [Cryomyces minteri]
MTKSPAVIIIARHGARLDAADKTWHLSSPAPYDPPLTYGGWTQSRALGARIASILHARDLAGSDVAPPRANATNGNFDSIDFASLDGPANSVDSRRRQKSRKRKHRVVIHTSPFLRCVQTSVAISAGIAQHQATQGVTRQRSVSPKGRAVHHLHSGSPRIHAIDGARSPALAPIAEPEEDLARGVLLRSLKEKRIQKATLRVDAFLGEWLSPDYFELITPPPKSTLMVAGAKADLLRRAENIDVFYSKTGSNTPTGNLWGQNSGSSTPTSSNKNVLAESGPLSNMANLAKALPRRDRTNSHSSVESTSSGRPSSPLKSSPKSTLGSDYRADTGTYTAPVPTYALSPSDPIPRGYVAHAREACVDVDYQWDSMREPLDWGDGGEFGEEWSAMHKRFRRGLNSLVHWYGEHGTGCMHRAEHDTISENAHGEEEDEDEDTELVVVLVTHGAGCNALIGALTNQPVLLDVGMASLTMAVRKEALSSADGRSASLQQLHNGRRSSVDLGLSDDFEMCLVASSEHLRAGVDPTRIGFMASPKMTAQSRSTAPEYRRRLGSYASGSDSPIDSSFTIGGPARSSVSSALGSIRRSSVQAGVNGPTGGMFQGGLHRSYTVHAGARVGGQGGPPPPPVSAGLDGGGLWSRPSPAFAADTPEGRESPGRNMVLNFGGDGTWNANDAKTANGSIPTQSTSTTPSAPPATATTATITTPTSASTSNSILTSPSNNTTNPPPQTDHEDEVDVIAPLPSSAVPPKIGRSLSQHGLWGSPPTGSVHERERGPKRRWSVQQE